MKNLNTKRIGILFFSVVLCFSNYLAAQEDWNPETHITGYINTIAEWTDLESYKDADKDLGIGLSEVGFLASYKPIKKLEIKSTLVYTHKITDIQSLIVEAYGLYTFSEKFKIGAGKFLTPLSPINVYFYAPLNPSGILPMVISHHFLTPQSISGFQILGEFGKDLKVGYNLTYGNYTTLGHIRNGIIGLIGSEDFTMIPSAVSADNQRQNYDLGGSLRAYLDYNGSFILGLNYFQGTRATLSYMSYDPMNPLSSEQLYAPSRKHSLGVDLHLNYNDKLKLNAEYWDAKNKTTDLDNELSFSYTGYYGELIYNQGVFMPFFRYEYVEDLKILGVNPGTGDEVFRGESSLTSIGGGIAIRPLYEVLLKLDIRQINPDVNDIVKSYGATDDNYMHLVASLVLSF